MARRSGDGTPPPRKSFWQKYQWFIIAGVALLFITQIAFPALQSNTGKDDGPTSVTPVPIGEVEGEIHFKATTREHVPFGTMISGYNSYPPPTSGEHWSQGGGVAPAKEGIYSQPIADEALVHNLEHGHIVILHRDTLSNDDVQQLVNFLQGQPGFPTGFLIAPRAQLPVAYVMSAWEYYLPLYSFDEQKMTAFIAAHYDKGPEALIGGEK